MQIDIDTSPLVSVITPLYNAERFISETIKSVQNQTYTNWEMIIVNDQSSDKGVELVKVFQKDDERIILLENDKNEGAAVSRNKAIESAKGRFIAFLDSDDLWLPEKLDTQVKFMLEKDVAFSFAAYEKVDMDGNKFGQIDVPEKVDYYSLLKTCSVGCLTAVYDSEKLGKVYMPNIRKRQDYGLWLRILKIIPNGFGINTTLAKYRVRKDSISGNKFSAAKYQWNVYRNVEQLGLLKSVYYFTYYTIYGFVKTYFK